MSNQLDFMRFSSFVNGVVDRKINPISSAIAGSTGYLRSLITQSQTYTTQALNYSTQASASALDAATSASTALIVLNDFSGTWLGIRNDEPTVSSQGNPVTANAFYIRRSDGRFRYVSGFTSGGAPIYADATVAADPSSLSSAGTGVFLNVNVTNVTQTVRGAVQFQSTVLVPSVASWTSQQAVPAIDLNNRITTVNNAISAETTRATTAETSLANGKVSKSGDTMSGQLTIQSTGETAAITLFNTTATTGRRYRWMSANTGSLRLVDDTNNIERMAISTSGVVSAAGGFSTTGIVAGADVVSTRSDGSDSGFTIQLNGTNRWILKRSSQGQRFYIARMNSNGVFQDTPISISESDGALTLNKTLFADTITVNGSAYVNSVAATAYLNNTVGTNDTSLVYQQLGITRWAVGRIASAGTFAVRRFSDQGAAMDTPFQISEITGVVSMNGAVVANGLTVNGSITTPFIVTSSNGAGQNVRIGDDAWIGDGNIANGLTIRGQANFNSGYVSFGNSGRALGCDGTDANLKYNGDVVVVQSQLASYVSSLFSKGSNTNGRWRSSPDGYVEQSGTKTGPWNTETTVAVTFPVAYTTTPPMSAILLTPIGDATGGLGSRYKQDLWGQVLNGSVTTTGFQVILQSDDGLDTWLPAFNWRCLHDNS